MLRGNRVGRWEQSEDLLQQALLRLNRLLEQAPPSGGREMLELAAVGMRHALIDFARRYFGPMGIGAHHLTDPGRSHTGDDWSEFLVSREDAPNSRMESVEQWQQLYAAIDELPDEERKVVDLIFIHELTQVEAATVLGVALKTVGRRWRRALVNLHETLRDKLPAV